MTINVEMLARTIIMLPISTRMLVKTTRKLAIVVYYVNIKKLPYLSIPLYMSNNATKMNVSIFSVSKLVICPTQHHWLQSFIFSKIKVGLTT